MTHTSYKRRLAGAALAISFCVGYQNCSGFSALRESGDFSSSLGALDPSEAPSKLACTAPSTGTSEKTMRRLSKVELTNSLTDLFGAPIASRPDVQSALQIIPDQTMPAGSFSTYDNSVQDVQGLLEVSQKLVDATFANTSDITRVLSGCASDQEACRVSLVDKFAYRAWRRPLSVDERAEVMSLARTIGGNDGLKYAMMRVLLSPNFHQHIEIGEDLVTDPQRIKLTQYEIASRLAFRLTGTLPDVSLLDEAAAGRLGTLPALDIQAKRLLQSQAARKFWRAFFDRWLDGQRILDPSQTVADEIGITAAGLKAETREELLRFTEYVVFDKKGNFQDLFTDPTVFPFTDRLAKLFNTQKSDSGVKSTAGFGGVILRPGKLASGGNYTTPITRGVYIQKFILCTNLPSPSPDIVASRNDEIEKLSHDLYSSREITTSVTSPKNCMGCHSMINPAGFALEGFSPLGRPRMAEKIYGASGDTGRTHVINTYVDNLNLGSSPTPAADATEFVQRISRSAVAKECFSQKLAESTRYRGLASADNCVVNDIRASTQAGAPLIDAIRISVVNDGILWKSQEGVQR